MEYDGMFWNRLECSGMFQKVMESHGMSKNLLEHSRTCRNVLECYRMFWEVPIQERSVTPRVTFCHICDASHALEYVGIP